MTLGVFLPSGLGELVMATPMLRALRKHFGPKTRLVGISPSRWGQLLEGTAWLDEQWHFATQRENQQCRDWTLLRQMREARFETLLLCSPSLHAHTLAWLSGAKERVGYAYPGGGRLLTKKLTWSANGRPAGYSKVDLYLRLAETVGCPAEPTALELGTLQRDENSADELYRELGLPSDASTVLLNPGASEGSAKLWPVERFAELARSIANELQIDVLVLSTSRSRQISGEIIRRAGNARVFSLADFALDLGTLKAVIRRGRVMVSGDDPIRFVAAAFGRPVISLFGPTCAEPKLPFVRSVNLASDVACRGCQNRVCPLKHQMCMKTISVETVYGEVAKVLEESLAVCAA